MKRVLFEESQRMAILVVIIALTSLPFLMMSITQIVTHKPVGNHPLSTTALIIIALLCIGGSVLASFQKLKTRITDEGIYISFGIFAFPKTIKLSDIKSISIRRYNGLKEFWGWGVKFNSNGTCYTVSGNIGLDITLLNDKKILIGAQREKDLQMVLKDPLFEKVVV